MYNWVLAASLAASDDAGKNAAAASIRSRLQGLPGVVASMAERTLPGVYNGGDLICRAVFKNGGIYKAATVSPEGRKLRSMLDDKSTVPALNEVTYNGGLSGGTPNSPTVYRVALFYANVNPTRERLDQFRTQTAAMPRYIKSIQRWQLSTTDSGTGLHPWTHVWEQEYATLGGLTGTYIMHPEHWSNVERWFDPEYPEWLVDPVLVHTFCNITKPAIVT